MCMVNVPFSCSVVSFFPRASLTFWRVLFSTWGFWNLSSSKLRILFWAKSCATQNADLEVFFCFGCCFRWSLLMPNDALPFFGVLFCVGCEVGWKKTSWREMIPKLLSFQQTLNGNIFPQLASFHWTILKEDSEVMVLLSEMWTKQWECENVMLLMLLTTPKRFHFSSHFVFQSRM